MEKYTMTDPPGFSFSDGLLAALSAFRTTDRMVDVNLCAGLKVFPCHRLVLAATSPYFDTMFNSGLRETREYEVFIKGVTEQTMEIMIEYFYTGSVDITCDNAVDVFHASDLFQVDALKDASVEFLTKHLDPENCLQLWNLAKRFYCLNLEAESIRIIVDRFTEVVDSEHFLELTAADLCLILADDRLNVSSEEVACNAACDWLNHDCDNRISIFSDVLKNLRLPLVPIDHLVKCFQPIVGSLSNEALNFMDEAKIFHLFPAKQPENDSPRTKSRMNFDYRDAVVLIGSRKLPNHAVGVDVKCIDMATMEISHMEYPPNLQTVDFAVCTYGPDIYISGGTKSPTDLIHFHAVHQKWKSRCPMNDGRARHVMAAVGKHIYAFGGYSSGTIMDSIEQYSVTFDSWSNVGRLNQAVCLSAAQAVGQNIYVLGGLVSEQTTTSIIQSFDARTNQVTTLSNQLPLRCALHRSTIQRDTLYVVNRTGKVIECGLSSAPSILSQIDGFNRGHFGVIFYHGSIYIIENDTESADRLYAHRYDTANGNWTTRVISSPEKLPVISFCVRTLVKHDRRS